MSTKKKMIIAIIGVEVIIIAAVIGFLCYINSDTVKINRQLELAQHYLLEEDYEQAIAIFESVIEIDPKNVEAYLGLAEAYAETDDLTNAVKILERGSKRTGSDEIKEVLAVHTEEVEKKERAAQRAAEAADAAAADAADAAVRDGSDSQPAEKAPESVQTGFVEQNGELYYYDGQGNLVTGWFDADRNRYYARNDGSLCKDGEYQIDGTKYDFDPKGVCLGEAQDEQALLFAQEDAELLRTLNSPSNLTGLMEALANGYILSKFYLDDDRARCWSNLDSLLAGEMEGIESFFAGEFPIAYRVYCTGVDVVDVGLEDELYQLSGCPSFITEKDLEFLIFSICGKRIDVDLSGYPSSCYDSGSDFTWFTWNDPYFGYGGIAGDITDDELHDITVERVDANTWKVRGNDMKFENDELESIVKVCFTVIKNPSSGFNGYSIIDVEAEFID